MDQKLSDELDRITYDPMEDEYRNRFRNTGTRLIVDILPVTYGKKAPAGFGGRPDEAQRKFNLMVHYAQDPHEASYAAFDAGMVVPLPHDAVWCHWLVTGDLKDEYLAFATDDEIVATLRSYHAIVRAYGMSREEFFARMMIRNEQVFEEWLVDYAKRQEWDLEYARKDVLDAQRAAARNAGSVPAGCRPKPKVPARHATRWYLDLDFSDVDCSGVVCHARELSYEHTRERIASEKAKCASERAEVWGLTVSDMNKLGLDYKQLKRGEGWRVNDDAEVVVVRHSTGKVVRSTGMRVERLVRVLERRNTPPEAVSGSVFDRKVTRSVPKATATENGPKMAPQTARIAIEDVLDDDFALWSVGIQLALAI